MKILNWENSIYTDASRDYLSNQNPELGEEIKITIRVLKKAPVEGIVLCYMHNGNEELLSLNYKESIKKFNYYTCKLKVTESVIEYWFKIYTTYDQTYYYNKAGIFIDPQFKDYNFKILANYHSPKWLKDRVFYQIFPDRFYNGNPDNDIKNGEYSFRGCEVVKKDWTKTPGDYEENKCLDFFGGDLEGIKKKIHYLKDLGVNAIYLTPVFKAATNHKYDTLDYLSVDPYLGGEEAFRDLMSDLDKNSIKLILDISINHTSINHKWLQREEKKEEYYFFEQNGDFYSWKGEDKFFVLNYSCDKLSKKIYEDNDSVLKKWIKEPFNIDGWRFDSANSTGKMNEVQVSDKLWKGIRKNIKAVKKDSYLIGETWFDGQEFLQGDKWDGAINYFGFCQPLRRFLNATDWFECDSGDAKSLTNGFKDYFAKLPRQVAYNQFNFFDNHDLDRLHINSNISFESYRAAVILLFILPGVPCIYYGDEIALQGHNGSVEGSRYPMEWEEKKQDKTYYNFYQKMISLKKEEEVLQTGSFKILYDEGNIFSFVRFNQKKAYLVISSQENRAKTIDIPICFIGDINYSQIKEVFDRENSYQIEKALLDSVESSYIIPKAIMEVDLKKKETLLFEIKI